MGLTATLYASVNALAAHSKAIETAGKNLANVDNANYARQRVIYSQAVTVSASGSQPLGLQANVEQVRDGLLDKQVLREVARSANFAGQQAAYQRAQSALGESISSSSASATANSTTNTGVSAALDDFFNAFQTFAANPTSTAQRQALLQTAATLTDRLQSVDQDLAQVQTDLNTQIASDVTAVNTLLQQVADLNQKIGQVEINAPGAASDLRDQRQTVLEQLAGKLNFDTTEAADGQIQVTAKDGSNANVVMVNASTVVGPLTFTGTVFQAGATPTTLALTGGRLQGALTARNGAVKDLRDNLTALASQLVTSVNGAYNPLNTTGENFFNSSGSTAGTIALDGALTATNLKASNGGAASDNTIALSVAGLVSTVWSTGAGADIDGTFGNFLSNSVGQIGQALATTNTKITNQSTVENLVRSQRDSISGVSLDEEMADLVKYQRAFQASSRVFSTVDQLLDLVVNQMGR
jgi:flagellar hook-associated protein 1 FlgK